MNLTEIISILIQCKNNTILDGSLESEGLLFDIFNDIETVEYVVDNRNLIKYLLESVLIDEVKNSFEKTKIKKTVESNESECKNGNIYEKDDDNLEKKNVYEDKDNYFELKNNDLNKKVKIDNIETNKTVIEDIQKFNYFKGKTSTDYFKDIFKFENEIIKLPKTTINSVPHIQKLIKTVQNTNRTLFLVPPGFDYTQLFFKLSQNYTCEYFKGYEINSELLFIADTTKELENNEIELFLAAKNKRVVALSYFCDHVEWIAQFLEIEKVLIIKECCMEVEIKSIKNNENIENLIKIASKEEKPMLIFHDKPEEVAHGLFVHFLSKENENELKEKIKNVNKINNDDAFSKKLNNYLEFGISLSLNKPNSFCIHTPSQFSKNLYKTLVICNEDINHLYRAKGVEKIIVLKSSNNYLLGLESKIPVRSILKIISRNEDLNEWNKKLWGCLGSNTIKLFEENFIKWENETDKFKNTYKGEILIKYNLSIQTVNLLDSVKKTAIERTIRKVAPNAALLSALKQICIFKNFACATLVDKIIKEKKIKIKRKIVKYVEKKENYYEIGIYKDILVDVYVIDLNFDLLFYDSGENLFVVKVDGVANCIVSEVECCNCEEFVLGVE